MPRRQAPFSLCTCQSQASVSSATDSIATQCSTDVSYATLDLHSGTVVPTMVDTLARPTEPLYHGAVHAYAEIDFSQSDKK